MDAQEFLNKTIEEYNKTASNIAKFKFNNSETKMFVKMMIDYTKQANDPKTKNESVEVCQTCHDRGSINIGGGVTAYCNDCNKGKLGNCS